MCGWQVGVADDNALTTQGVDPYQDSRPEKNVEIDANHPPLVWLLEKTTANPFIEGSHGGAAPDLKIHAAAFIAVVGPMGRLAQIRTKYQGHQMFGILFGPLHLTWGRV